MLSLTLVLGLMTAASWSPSPISGPQRIAILGGHGTISVGPGGPGGGHGGRSWARLRTLCLDGDRSAPLLLHKYGRVLGSMSRGFGDPIVSGLAGGPRSLSFALSRGDVSLVADRGYSSLVLVNNRNSAISVQFGEIPVVVGGESDDTTGLSASTIPKLSDLEVPILASLGDGSEEGALELLQEALWAYRDAAALGYGPANPDPTPLQMRETIQAALRAFDWPSDAGLSAISTAASLRQNNLDLDGQGSAIGLIRRRGVNGAPQYLILGSDGRPQGAWRGVGELAGALTAVVRAGPYSNVYLKVMAREGDAELGAVLADVTANGDLRSRGVRAVRIDQDDKKLSPTGGGTYVGFFRRGLIRLEDVSVSGSEASTRVMYAGAQADLSRKARPNPLERILRFVAPSHARANHKAATGRRAST